MQLVRVIITNGYLEIILLLIFLMGEYFDINSETFTSEFRKMSFKGTQANISDSNGNLLMASNGIWIANATGDTMLNGGGLNPGLITPNWQFGMPMTYNNIFCHFHPDTK
jgi:hypothetical protein